MTAPIDLWDNIFFKKAWIREHLRINGYSDCKPADEDTVLYLKCHKDA